MDSTRISQTTPQFKRATALLGKNAALMYMTVLMYLFRVIKPMMSMNAKAIVACTMRKLQTIPGSNSTFSCTKSLSRTVC